MSRTPAGPGTKGLVSVVMPCFNAERYVAAAVRSVLTQTYADVELIVIDDGSTDRSASILAEVASTARTRMRLLRTERVGPYPARNVGLRHAQGEYVAFLDADDWWLPKAVQKLLAALHEQSADLAYCGWQNVGEGVVSKPYVPPSYESDDPVDHLLKSCPWPIHAALLRRSIVDQLGGFSERRFASMDYDFWLRTLALTRRMVRVPEVLAFYRWHGSGQVSAVKWRQVLDALEAKLSFVRDNPDLVGHISPDRLLDLTEGEVLRQAYRAVWRRDLVSAQRLFRHSARARSFGRRDFAHVACAFLPKPLYAGLIGLRDRSRGASHTASQ